ncbi:hypothetical protein HaLaN_24084 [Haematococcus lacustris]|uniref:Uncharacterized protein n=1 Tax=Haematococcus lacustris TaxID=44745 RepID=A0A6A0A2F8_HAELA|nr:hypothetical protein HaLaN_24084 [Haematococcus lacustris]
MPMYTTASSATGIHDVTPRPIVLQREKAAIINTGYNQNGGYMAGYGGRRWGQRGGGPGCVGPLEWARNE